ncbi:putative uncharacterized protein [Caballeronia insecticola]|uniref:DUF5672 domain-containing protein n=1 Tax=Caballeronia insecticola TaxID=758793 RepID=R4WZ15_9BURK|nr:putative uncharacterized protein [Caballeronia insecticola]
MLKKSQEHCLFGDTILLTDKHVQTSTRIALIPSINSKEEYSAFILKHLVEYISTPWVLLIQWDGFITNPSAWTEEFLSFDYIGARWPWHFGHLPVGNGGFSLRSKRLLQILASDTRIQPDPAFGEDELICRTHRPLLEADYGIKFATEQVADQFSVECSLSSEAPFGFHGIFHLHRFANDSDLQFLARHAHRRTVTTVDFVALWCRCFEAGRMQTADALYEALSRVALPQEFAIICTYRGIDWTPEQIAERFAISQARLTKKFAA